MSRYGNVAIHAANLAKAGVCPIEAWNIAVNNEFDSHSASINKGCPKNAFLGLAQEGRIVGVPKGNYTKSKLNKDYAIHALNLLRSKEDNHDFLKSKEDNHKKRKRLWVSACGSETKVHNGQMDVVLCLWCRGLLK